MSGNRELEKLNTFRPQFFYTLDQLAQVMNLDEEKFIQRYIWKHVPSQTETFQPKKMIARNISTNAHHPDWRVTDEEFARWLKTMGFKPMTMWRMF